MTDKSKQWEAINEIETLAQASSAIITALMICTDRDNDNLTIEAVRTLLMDLGDKQDRIAELADITVWRPAGREAVFTAQQEKAPV